MSERPFEKVGVLLGGPSSEREVSLRSGAAVAKGLREAGYEVTEIDVTSRALDVPDGVEAVFVVLHGVFGEDGEVQALLREKGIPYTGSGPEASRASFDKTLSKSIFRDNGIPTPDFEVLCRGDERKLPLPVVVKPAREGSSIGVHIVRDEALWPEAFDEALSHNGEVIVESFIEGRELTVSVVGNEAFPAVEIEAPQGFYDYDAKYVYKKGKTRYTVPARISDECARQCEAWALRTFEVLGCRGFGRVDFRMNPAGELFVLELNNIPGFTETSLLPKAALAAGIDFSTLCDRILRMASVH